MSRTYRSSWGPELKARESRTSNENDWKAYVSEELEQMDDSGSVFVIVNEWTPEGSYNSSSEIVGNRFFELEGDAWDHLNLIAESHDIDLKHEETSFDLPPMHGISEQTFFIDELWSN